MNIKILSKEQSLEIISDKSFISSWQNLADASSEFTLIQEPDLVVPWYQAYQNQYDPVVVTAYDKENELIGVLPLAINNTSVDLSHAGDGQAEYNGWICKKEYEEEFLIKSLVLLKQEFGLVKWDWTWMPPNTDTSWLQSDQLKANGIYINISSCELPVYDLSDADRINKIKKSKSTKSKINRLKRSGDLRMERITDYEQAREIFTDLKKKANFRNIAAYNAIPFEKDSDSKEQWHLNHLDNSQNVHFTVLWQGDELLACNFGFCSEDTVIIGLFTYNPVQGAHSPGNVFLIYLIDYITEEGYKFLDLSPGGDPYKERFCNSHITLYRPTFCFTKACKYKNDLLTYAKNKVKEKYSYRDVMAIKSSLERKIDSIKKLSKEKQQAQQLFNNNLSLENLTNKNNLKIRTQRYDDLLLYKEGQGTKSHKEIIENSLKNFERGDILHSIVDGNKLVAFAWVSNSGKKHWNFEINEFSKLSSNNILIYDINTFKNRESDEQEDEKIFNSFISQVIENKSGKGIDKTENNNDKKKVVYLAKSPSVAIEAIEKMGFKPCERVNQ